MIKNIFLDTSIYIQKNFTFQNDAFQSLLNLSKEGYIQLYTTNITHNEILSNIDK
ncbi:PIN domain-containing protein, partial [Priestia megaterium]